MTADEFERAYAQRSGTTVDELRSSGRFVRPCHCGDWTCEGWKSVHIEPGQDWPEGEEFAFDPRFKDQAK